MKRLLYFLPIMIAACSEKKPEQIQPAIFIDQKLTEFVASNPDWAKDEITEKETTEKFRHKLINLSNEADFLKGMPLQLKEIKDTVFNEYRTKIAKFKAYGDTSRTENSLLNYVQLQINGIVSPDQIKNLVLNKNYTLAGTLYKQGKRADIKYIHVADFKGYDLGKYTFLITGFKPL